MTPTELKNQLQQAYDETNNGNYDVADRLANEVLSELENYRHPELVDWSQNDEQNLRAKALLALAFTNQRRGDFDLAIEQAHRALALAHEFNLNDIKTRAWNTIGNVYNDRGFYDKALEYFNSALAIHQELGATSGVALVTGNIGLVYDRLSSYDKALEYYNTSLATHLELGEKSSVARVTGNIGRVYSSLGSYDKALEYFNNALASHQELSEKSCIARVTGYIGGVYFSLGSYDKALEYFNTALASHQELGEKSAVARVTGNIGGVYFSLGSYDKALEYCNTALATSQELGDKSAVATCTGNIGAVNFSLGSYDKALEYYNSALATFQEIGEKSGVAGVTGNIGGVYFSLGSYDKALEYFNTALATHQELGAKSLVATFTGNIGHVYNSLGSYDRALEYFNTALASHQELGAKYDVANTTGDIGSTYANKIFDGYDPAKAEEFLLKALALSTEIGAQSLLVEFYKSLAMLYENEKRWEDAHLQFKKYCEIEKEVNVEEVKKQDSIRQQLKEIELAKAAAAAKLSATTTLLHRVLPESIASRMIAGEEDIADYFPSVSILFADIAGFTPLSADMPSYVVVRFLNYVFGEFDKIMKKYGCEKIKTIGDGYMAVAGAPIPCEDHAERMASASLAMQEAIQLPEEFREYLPAGKEFGIRVGLHTGAVVGGVIGDERFVYDIYSDAVNTAARMESHGEPDKIHVSHDYYIHLQNRFAMTKNKTHGMTFEKRGEMNIKGKGMMKTYFMEQTTNNQP